MGRSLNQVLLIGHVGADPDVRTSPGGSRGASFSLATSRRWTDRDGQAHEKTEWHRVIAWERLAEIADRHVRRGSRLFVEGRLEYRTWEDAAGRARHATEVIARDLIPLDGPRGRTAGNLPV